MQTLLKQAGLSEKAIDRCVKIFDEQGVDEEALCVLQETHLAELGLVMGDRVKLYNFLHKHDPTPPTASAPPGHLPMCEIHNHPLSGFCTKDSQLLCIDCVTMGEHVAHSRVDAPKGVKLLREKLQKWKPSYGIEQQVNKTTKKIDQLKKELQEAEQRLVQLTSIVEERSGATDLVASALLNTKGACVGVETLVALQELQQVWVTLQKLSPCEVCFSTVFSGQGRNDARICEEGKVVKHTGGSYYTLTVADNVYSADDGVINWGIDLGPSCITWTGFGVIPVSNVESYEKSGHCDRTPYNKIYGWSGNDNQWVVGNCHSTNSPSPSFSATGGTKYAVELDTSASTLTARNIATGVELTIESIKLPVKPCAITYAPGNVVTLFDMDFE